jgi:DeoR/GlpR family transcriptional regulator of sugar metabolism
MKRCKKDVCARQEKNVHILTENPDTSITEISKELDVSEITIRRDIKCLHEMGKIHRNRGKIVVKDFLNIDGQEIDEIEMIKMKLGQAASSLVHNNQTIFVNSGSTPLYVLKYLKDKKITIASNNVKVASVSHHPESMLILSGGEVRLPKEAMVGDATINFFENIKADAAIMGVYGINANHGITTSNPNEAKINEVILKQTNGPVIVVADYRKIGLIANFKSGELDRVNYLVTDSYADDRTIEAIEKKGISVIQVAI